MKGQLLLTFDVEDFINGGSTNALFHILKLLGKHNLQGLFFITGHMAEKLRSYRSILNLLMKHEIGFHSSAHSVRPTIFEYCDVEEYEDAIQTSIKRETAHINPLTGEIEQTGGIYALRDLFPSKNVVAYRAPGYYCPPPHLEALYTLGIRCDFSWNLSKVPVYYNGITFYPRPMFLDCEKTFLADKQKIINWSKLLRTLTRKTSVLTFHPHAFALKDHWDRIYYKGNPSGLIKTPSKEDEKTKRMLMKLEDLFLLIRHLERAGIVNTSTDLATSNCVLDVTKIDIKNVIEMFAFWPRTFFAYEPKHLYSQLSRFLGTNRALPQSAWTSVHI